MISRISFSIIFTTLCVTHLSMGMELPSCVTSSSPEELTQQLFREIDTERRMNTNFEPDVNHVCELIRQGANINAHDARGWTPLMYEVTMPEEYGFSPLIFNALIQAGADVNSINNERDSVLHIAVRAHNKAVIFSLITREANSQATNNAGHTSMDVASNNGAHEIADMIRFLVSQLPFWRQQEEMRNQQSAARANSFIMLYSQLYLSNVPASFRS
jgi:ankyrin repeat protein